jgi:pantetheine-phosphate adenylyltransferase
MAQKRIVYSGTFDPITLGHIDLIERALAMFDAVVVAVSTGHGKNTLFTLKERANLIKNIFVDYTNVEVRVFDGLLVDFVQKVQACAILRGLRAVSDFEYEFQMAAMNRKLNNGVETVFLTPSEKYTCLSSTMIREVALLSPERVEHMVPPCVSKALSEKYLAG